MHNNYLTFNRRLPLPPVFGFLVVLLLLGVLMMQFNDFFTKHVVHDMRL